MTNKFLSLWHDVFRETDYERFCSLISSGRTLEAVEFYPCLELPNGKKQIAMAQFATSLLRLEKYSEAKEAYETAIESEKSWGGRRSRSNSRYLIAYCEYFGEHSACKADGSDFKDWQRKLTYLECMPVSRWLQKYRLPLPRR